MAQIIESAHAWGRAGISFASWWQDLPYAWRQIPTDRERNSIRFVCFKGNP